MPPWKVTFAESQKLSFELIGLDVSFLKEQRQALTISICSMCVFECVQAQWSHAIPMRKYHFEQNIQFFTDTSCFWGWLHIGLNSKMTFSARISQSHAEGPWRWRERRMKSTHVIQFSHLFYLHSLCFMGKGQICNNRVSICHVKAHLTVCRLWCCSYQFS